MDQTSLLGDQNVTIVLSGNSFSFCEEPVVKNVLLINSFCLLMMNNDELWTIFKVYFLSK